VIRVAEAFLERAARRLGRPAAHFTPEALDTLRRCPGRAMSASS
jgi:transcriptional regulator with GAF, ATPase, and Fis domain